MLTAHEIQDIKQNYAIESILSGSALKKSGANWLTGPCPLCGGENRFTIKVSENRWHCRHCCHSYEDNITLVQRLNGCNFVSAVSWLKGGNVAKVDMKQRGKLKKRQTAENADFQDKATRILSQAHADLLSAYDGDSKALKALQWLAKRGIGQKSIRRFGLGMWFGGDGLRRGITIPSVSNGKVSYLKLRQPAGTPKYLNLAGGTAGLFNADELTKPHIKRAVITEGEFDAILLSDYLPGDAAAVTMGAANQTPDFADFGKYFALVDEIYLLQDNDEAGRSSAARWVEHFPYMRVLDVLPDGIKDATDYWQAGGNLSSILTS